MKLWFFALILLLAAPVRGAEPTRTLVFFGDSLTAGYGLDDPTAESYPALIQHRLEAAGRPWRVVNAGLSGETSSGGLRRIDWVLRQPVDLFVLALGANDGLRGIEPAVTATNLQGIIDRVRAKYPATRIVLAGMQMPPTMGDAYAREYAAVFPALAEKNHLVFIPFLLAGVATKPELNQPDGLHPNAAGAAVVAETVWQALLPLL
ncbi:MAG TPA: arylesterase [Opitutaceae bacterium]|nr:arylesterase [Opitutaceae bacterium]HND59997.1 arylesterase [Opitutaceae bacterium]